MRNFGFTSLIALNLYRGISDDRYFVSEQRIIRRKPGAVGEGVTATVKINANIDNSRQQRCKPLIHVDIQRAVLLPAAVATRRCGRPAPRRPN